MVLKGKKSKSPPILSHEFVIQNHADIVAVIAMIFMVGLMVEALHPIASSFIALSHNATEAIMESGAPATGVLYRAGPKDMLAVFFYTLIMILAHAVIQEFFLDKINKKLHLSKIKFAKFNESGQLLSFYAFSFIYAGNILWELLSSTEDASLLKFVSGLWTGYPEGHMMMWHMKLFYILQLAYWVHAFPELYLTKTKKEDMPIKIQQATLYIVTILFGYFMGYQRVMLVLLALHYLVEGVFHTARIVYFLDYNQIAQGGFRLWTILFALVRVASMIISVLTFWFGLGRVHAENPTTGSSIPLRTSAVAWVCGLQAWMTWNFITFQMSRGKDTVEEVKVKRAANGASKKKQ